MSAPEELVRVGSVRWDGDEFYDFRYTQSRERLPEGCIAVFVRAADAEGYIYTETREET